VAEFDVVNLGANPLVLRRKRLRQLGTTGMSEASFWDTFVKCFLCKKIVMKETALDLHRCTANPITREIIDLTLDED
jgi:hypothetical protein